MIDGIFKTTDLENVPTKETQRSYKKADRLRPDDTADVEDNKKDVEDKKKDVEDKKKEETLVDVKKAIERIDSAARFYNRQLEIELEEDLNITVVKVVDGETKEVIRQIPPEEIVALSKQAKDLKGLLIHKEV
ncbi:MAG: flagellar protein FlaG [Nitrospirae bacterium]|nr:flagellar protein FlaG [Nitrospirota bacterium]